MRNLSLGVAAATLLLSAAAPLGGADAAPSGQLIFGVDQVGQAPPLEQVQYIWGGRNYCWYDSAWRGPGWYWCGYGGRRGYGWGGGYGWRGWRGGHDHGGWHGGGHGGWHGGDHGGHGGDHGGHGR